LDEAQRWLDDGRPFAAHEVFEDAWKSCPAAERGLWQGLAQSAVALTHALRGNRTGARTVLARAQENLIPFASDPPYGLDLAALSDWSDRLDHALSTAPTGEAAQAPPIPPLRR
jgi:predicted metal-dependent hydrolase